MSPWRITRLFMFCLLGTMLLATATIPGELSWQEQVIVAAMAVGIAAMGVTLEYVDRLAEWIEQKANGSTSRKERGV